MNNLKVSLIQTDLEWENPDSNLERFSKLIQQIGATDLVILPEMFPTGFSMNPQANYEETGGKALLWMQETALERGIAICGSVIVKDGEAYYNRLYFVRENGEYSIYDKKHLFTLAGEEKIYTGGASKLILDYKGWKITPLICYDLRFPVWSRNVEESDLMIYVANWPERRSDAWKTLLKARAIENMCYVVGLNRIGNDGNGVYHSGDSAVHNELGEMISDIEPGTETVETYVLDKSRVVESRKRFNFLNDRDAFQII